MTGRVRRAPNWRSDLRRRPQADPKGSGYCDRASRTRGKEQRITILTRMVDEDFFVDGKMFDGSSIAVEGSSPT
jgi:hypothetical protein